MKNVLIIFIYVYFILIYVRFIFGKNKVVSLAFGRKPESEYKSQLHRLCPYLAGNVGLLFTNSSKDEVLK